MIGFSLVKRCLGWTRFAHLVSWGRDPKENLNQLLKVGAKFLLEYLLMKMQFWRTVLPKNLRIMKSLNDEPAWEFLLWKNIFLRNSICNKWINLTDELVLYVEVRSIALMRLKLHRRLTWEFFIQNRCWFWQDSIELI